MKRELIRVELPGPVESAAAAWLEDKLPLHGYEVAITMAGGALMISAHRPTTPSQIHVGVRFAAELLDAMKH